ncbi:NAD-dependent epimerase/dehydratase family protein [Caenispirillum bisanense]|uniref:Nucleoside-diphosphate-sugar epimerase n=1 Tax=Caenispirillum bisanense TaxID=414052 RepID=A0A286GUL6_9PROT|nr:NAD-dependent epimerase/dehydratase family protein [Caenispirillum bisanense]SOD98809.1 Nucleoside-diphosphate-sugar epimerase [Caenispirillum bisanense]
MTQDGPGGGRRVVVTGAAGFVGRALCARLAADGWQVTALVRRPSPDLPAGVAARVVGDLAAPDADLAALVAGADAVAHLAAKVHVMRPTPADEADFRRVNTDLTRRLAEAAAAAGVRRFLFLSTIKVNGDGTAPGRPYRADDPPAPTDAYGRSKAEAEAALAAVAAAHPGFETVVIRPPVVYGPGVAANIAALARLCDTGLPLPFGATRNARSLISVDNLTDAAAVALAAPAAGQRTYLVRDGEDVSTGELIRRLRRAQGRPARLVPVPQGAMTAALRLLGRGALADRLFGSLTVDDGPIRAELGWQPPLTLDQGLARMLGRG